MYICVEYDILKIIYGEIAQYVIKEVYDKCSLKLILVLLSCPIDQKITTILKN